MQYTVALQQDAHAIADRLGRQHPLWLYYQSIAVCLDDLVTGNVEQVYCIPFAVHMGIQDDHRFDPEIVHGFKAEWAKDIAWAGVAITGIAQDIKDALKEGGA